MEDKNMASMFDIVEPIIRHKVRGVLDQAYAALGKTVPAGLNEVLEKVGELNRYVAVNSVIDPEDFAGVLCAYGKIVDYYNNIERV